MILIDLKCFTSTAKHCQCLPNLGENNQVKLVLQIFATDGLRGGGHVRIKARNELLGLCRYAAIGGYYVYIRCICTSGGETYRCDARALVGWGTPCRQSLDGVEHARMALRGSRDARARVGDTVPLHHKREWWEGKLKAAGRPRGARKCPTELTSQYIDKSTMIQKRHPSIRWYHVVHA
jgi:hypothetical protein